MFYDILHLDSDSPEPYTLKLNLIPVPTLLKIVISILNNHLRKTEPNY